MTAVVAVVGTLAILGLLLAHRLDPGPGPVGRGVRSGPASGRVARVEPLRLGELEAAGVPAAAAADGVEHEAAMVAQG